jgi:hypothetical protein
VSDGG